ncbi:hypothetical protein GQ44DRAFT_708998 [Phaeosphaeriaceae sp. PMI808]|nr:hypothetical protein GQ44DRAFT_708998 [Phaeosphaeriaceae sp. PMI808]
MTAAEIHRPIEGGSVQFLDGCQISAFSVNPSVNITNALSIKVDANTILLQLDPRKDYSPLLVKNALASDVASVRFFRPTTHAQNSLWDAQSVVGFYQPEHALEALKWLSRVPGMQGQLLYIVYATVPKTIFNMVLLQVKLLWVRRKGVEMVWDQPRDGKTTLRLTGVRKDLVIAAKESLVTIFSGDLALSYENEKGKSEFSPREIWHDFFGTPPGETWLQHLGREWKSAIITSDRFQRRLWIYEQNHNGLIIGHLEQLLAAEIRKLSHVDKTFTFEFDTEGFKTLFASGASAKVEAILGKDKVRLDICKKTITLTCSSDRAYHIAAHFDLPVCKQSVTKEPECPNCGSITQDVQFSNCDHVCCHECFDHQVNAATTDLTRNHFPIVCWQENCRKAIAIADLRKYTTGEKLDMLLKASLTYHIRSYPDLYRNCRKPDCNSVYLRDGSYEIFICPTCLTQTCTQCHAEPHIGFTCAAYAAHVRQNQQNEQLLEQYKAEAGTKGCPSCTTLIEKIDGCHHVECSGCHSHICWSCLEVFATSNAAYAHMSGAHGGNGVNAVPGEEDTDEDDDDDDDDLSEWPGEDDLVGLDYNPLIWWWL